MEKRVLWYQVWDQITLLTFQLNAKVIITLHQSSSLPPWWRLKHSVKISPRFSDLKVGIRELSFSFSRYPTGGLVMQTKNLVYSFLTTMYNTNTHIQSHPHTTHIHTHHTQASHTHNTASHHISQHTSHHTRLYIPKISHFLNTLWDESITSWACKSILSLGLMYRENIHGGNMLWLHSQTHWGSTHNWPSIYTTLHASSLYPEVVTAWEGNEPLTLGRCVKFSSHALYVLPCIVTYFAT